MQEERLSSLAILHVHGYNNGPIDQDEGFIRRFSKEEHGELSCEEEAIAKKEDSLAVTFAETFGVSQKSALPYCVMSLLSKHGHFLANFAQKKC